MITKREFLPQGGIRRERSAEQIAAAQPFGLDFPATTVGVSGNITVAYDPDLGPQGLALAEQMVNVVLAPYNDMEMLFGIAGGAVTVVIAPLSGNNDGSGGAYHYGCDFSAGGTMYLDATFANTTVNPLQLEIGLYVAELSESFMGPQNLGWNCGFSNGEGLSRFCAEEETPAGTLDGFTSGPAWAQAGFPDWVSQTEQTDRDYVSTGCAIVYIYWMRSMGYTIPQIVQAGGATLQQNYQNLTGLTTAYQDLYNAVNGLQVTTDNPFGNLYGVSESPSAVDWANGITVFHQGYGDNGQLWYTYFDGTNWGEDTYVPNLGVSDSPSTLVYNGNLYVFHQGGGNNGQLWYSVFDGSNWSSDTQVPNLGMSGSPSAVLWDGGITVFHQGFADSGQLWYTYSADGINWGGDTQVPNVGMSGSPSAIVYNGLLYVFHQGYGNSGQLWYSVFDGTNWSGDTQIQNLGMSASPSAVLWAGGITVFHQGFADSGQLWYTYSADGTNWGGDTQAPNVGMSASPSAVVYNGVLFIFHQGFANSGELWYTAFDGTNWGADTYLRNLGDIRDLGDRSRRVAIEQRGATTNNRRGANVSAANKENERGKGLRSLVT
jgi:hypothetical protein